MSPIAEAAGRAGRMTTSEMVRQYLPSMVRSREWARTRMG